MSLKKLPSLLESTITYRREVFFSRHVNRWKSGGKDEDVRSSPGLVIISDSKYKKNNCYKEK